jgi:phage virion morphogenesis protein
MSARITLDLKTAGVGAKLKRLRKVTEDDGRLALLDIGEYLMGSTRDRAARQVGPDGTPWTPLSPAYKKYKAKVRPGVKMLKFDNHMLGDMLSYQVDQAVLLLGTNAPYGAIHQFGGKTHRAAHSRLLSFNRDARTGEVGNRFVKRSKSNFEQWATVPAYDVPMPARPWLGLSREDETEVVAILTGHLERALGGK